MPGPVGAGSREWPGLKTYRFPFKILLKDIVFERWGWSEQADRISCFNRHWAERAGYWEKTTFFEEEGKDAKKKPGLTVFYDSVTSEPLFQAPVGRYLRVCARARVPGCLRSTLQCARVCLSSTPEAYPLLCVHGSGTPFTIWQELGGFCARVTASRLAFV